MDDRTAREILQRPQKLERESARLRRGVVTDDSPLSVALGGSDIPYVGLAALEGLALKVGDSVMVLMRGHDLLVLGALGSRTVRGEISDAGAVVLGAGYSVVKSATGVYDVTFAPELTSTPVVVLGCGPVVGSLPRLSTTVPVTASGFRAVCFNVDTPASNIDAPFTFAAFPA